MSGEVGKSWQRIEAWLKKEVPELAAKLVGPAPERAIKQAEEAMGLEFPADVRASYLLQDGVQYGVDELTLFPPELDGIMDMAMCLLPAKGLHAEWKIWADLIDMGEFEGLKSEPQTGITDDWWSKGWLPVAGNGGGDFVCIDLAPTPEGKVGQVILAWHDGSERVLLASSWGEYLSNVADTMEAGRIRFDEDYGLITAGA